MDNKNLIIEAVVNTHVYSYPEGERPPRAFLECFENEIFKKPMSLIRIINDSKLDLAAKESVAMLEVILARLEIEYKRFLEFNKGMKEYDFLKKHFQARVYDILSGKSQEEQKE